MLSNYHTHSSYCDGKSTLREIVTQAIAFGIQSIGLSSHAALPFTCHWCMKKDALINYLHEVEQLKTEFPGLEIYKGLEIDYIPNIINPRQFSAQLDYTIGSIHFVNTLPNGTPWEIDGTLPLFEAGLKEIYQDNINAVIHDYFTLTREMITDYTPTIVGHLDKIKIQNAGNKFFNENEAWYQKELLETLNLIKQHECIVEVNTRGLYMNKTTSPYPSEWTLTEMRKLNIPITLNSDAHHAKDLISGFDTAIRILQDVGFRKTLKLQSGRWVESAI